ncbi:MAG TPA: cytochrome P450 [Ktedonobacteraceae bacterium]|nr:cytochrome P450 [Ktedonobacteraceae bacterium]
MTIPRSDTDDSRKGTATLTYESLPFLDVFSSQYANDPVGTIRALGEGHIMARSPRGLECLTYDLSWDLLRDERFPADWGNMLSACGLTPEDEAYRLFAVNLNSLEGDAHRHQRRLLNPLFSTVALAPSHVVVRQIVADLLDHVDYKGFDFAVEVAPHVPSALFCHLIGAPLEDRDLIAECSTSLLKIFRVDPRCRDEIEMGARTLVRYVRDHIERKRSDLGEDGLSRLIEAEQRGETTTDEIVELLFTLLTASTDNSSASLSQMVMAFAECPDQWDLLRKQPSLIANAVLESARVHPGMWSDPRFSRDEHAFGGIMIPGGTWLFASIVGANHDSSIFEAPDALRIDRKHPRPIFNFGFGHHACIGRPAALVELEETLRLLVERFSRIEVIGDIVRDGHPHGDYIRNLPVRMTIG